MCPNRIQYNKLVRCKLVQAAVLWKFKVIYM
jgi:hypothetical protein